MATSNLNLGGGAWFDKNFYDLLRENITPGAYTADQVQDAIKGSGWYGRLGGGSNPYGAAGEVLSRLGQNIGSNYSPPAITGKDAMPYYFSGYAPMPEGVKYYGIPLTDPDTGEIYEDRNFFDAAGNRAVHKNAEYDQDTGALISPGGWEIQPGGGARDETLGKYKTDKQNEYVANQSGYWRRQAEDRSPEGIARANDDNDDSLFGSLSPLLQIGAGIFGGPIGAGAFSLVNSGGDIESALKAGALAYAGGQLSDAFGGGSTPSITDELSFTDGNYWDGAAALSGDAAASYPVETIATPQSFELPATSESGLSAADQIATGEQFANNVVPGGVSTDVPSVESVPDYANAGYDVPNDPYFAPEPVSPLSPPATFDPNSINADIYNAPPPSGPATGSGIGGLNNSIYQPVLQSLTDFGVPWEVVQALPSVINSSLQGGALSSLTGGSFGTGAGMGAISSVLGNYLNSKGYNVPTSLLGAATSIIGSGLGLFNDGPSASGGNTRPNSGSPSGSSSGSSSGSTTINQQGGAILPFAPVANLMTAGRQVQAPNEFGGISAQLANITPYQSSPMSPLAYKDTPFQDYESILNATPAAHGGLMHLEDGGIAKQMAEISEKIKKITAPERKEVSQDALIKDYLNRQALSASKQDFISPLSSKMMKGRGVKAQSFSGLPQEAAASPIPRMSATITPMNPLQNTANFIPSSRIPFAAHGGQIHPDLARVLEGRNVQMDREYVPGPEGRLYAKHDIRGFAVGGPGTGQSDDIPTMLSDGEYVIDADTVAALGDGSSKAGASVLDKFRQEIRKHKRSAPVNDIPSKAKSPMEYMKMARRSKP